MKLLLVILVYVALSFLLGWGILLSFKGNPWLLIIAFVTYCISFAKIGCLPGKSH